MEEYNNEKYMVLENVENLFKRINRFGNEYNYCINIHCLLGGKE